MADFSLGQEMLTCRSKQNEIDSCEFLVTAGLKRMLGLRTFCETHEVNAIKSRSVSIGLNCRLLNKLLATRDSGLPWYHKKETTCKCMTFFDPLSYWYNFHKTVHLHSCPVVLTLWNYLTNLRASQADRNFPPRARKNDGRPAELVSKRAIVT